MFLISDPLNIWEFISQVGCTAVIGNTLKYICLKGQQQVDVVMYCVSKIFQNMSVSKIKISFSNNQSFKTLDSVSWRGPNLLRCHWSNSTKSSDRDESTISGIPTPVVVQLCYRCATFANMLCLIFWVLRNRDFQEEAQPEPEKKPKKIHGSAVCFLCELFIDSWGSNKKDDEIRKSVKKDGEMSPTGTLR